MQRFILLGLLAAILASAVCSAQSQNDAAAAEPGPLYRLFSSVTYDSVLEKLNQHGAAGYRFVDYSPTVADSIAVVMQRADSGPYEYAFVRAGVRGPKLAAAMNELGQRGFRYVPASMRVPPSKGLFHGPDVVLLMEKSQGSGKYEYQAFAPVLEKSLRKELGEATSAGFHPVVASLVNGALCFVVVERQPADKPTEDKAEAKAEPVERYKFVRVNKLKEREKQITEQGAAGFRILSAEYAPNVLQPLLVVLVEKTGSNAEYKFLSSDMQMAKDNEKSSASQQTTDFMTKLNEFGAQGYRVVPMGPFGRVHVEGNFKFNVWREASAVLEKHPGQRFEYEYVDAEDMPELARKLTKLAGQGFVLMRSGLLGNDSAFVERVTEEPAPVTPR
jgi:hypothetical protein